MDKMNESDAFLENSRIMFEEILQLGHHPSIILWGYCCGILGDADWFWEKPQDPVRLNEHFEAAHRFLQVWMNLPKS